MRCEQKWQDDHDLKLQGEAAPLENDETLIKSISQRTSIIKILSERWGEKQDERRRAKARRDEEHRKAEAERQRWQNLCKLILKPLVESFMDLLEDYLNNLTFGSTREESGPQILRACNSFLIPGTTRETSLRVLTSEELATSPLLPRLVDEQYQRVADRGFAIDEISLGVTKEQVLSNLQQEVIEHYWTLLDYLNRHFFTNYSRPETEKKKKSS